MSAPKQFEEPTHWEVRPDRVTQGWTQGWTVPHADFYIGSADKYWGRVLDEARKAYGDPNIRYNTDDVHQERYLVFGDGSRLPADGIVVYHDAATGQNYRQNGDGTVSPPGGDNRPMTPSAYRKAADGSYAPVDAHGHQISPLQAGIPFGNNGLHTDPRTGLLTPKNAAGDYYTLGPDGSKSYFDKDGTPISAERYGGGPPATGPTADAVPGATDEQQSGRAADAVKKLQDELKGRYSVISSAEEKLSEVLLNAHATNSDGQQRLNAIQHKIIDAVNDPALSLDTPAGEAAFLRFLRGQVKDIGDVVQSGDLTAEDQANAARALAQLYGQDIPAERPGSDLPALDAPPNAAPSVPVVAPDPLPTAGTVDPDPAPADPMPGPMPDAPVSEPVNGFGADPMSELASMLPGTLGGLASSPLDGLSGLAGAAAPLAGLASPGTAPDHDHDAEASSDHHDAKAADGDHPRSDDRPHVTDPPPPGVQGDATPGAGAPPAGPAAAPSATTLVALPDGSSATAHTAALAQAVKANLAGTPVDAAYRDAGIALPPPGTPVTNPVDPSALSCGAVGMFKDHYVVALSAVKAYQNGQVVPLAAVASSPDFLGWVDPTALGTPLSAPAVAPAPQPAPMLPG